MEDQSYEPLIGAHSRAGGGVGGVLQDVVDVLYPLQEWVYCPTSWSTASGFHGFNLGSFRRSPVALFRGHAGSASLHRTTHSYNLQSISGGLVSGRVGRNASRHWEHGMALRKKHVD